MGLCSTKFGAGSASDVLANTNWIKEVVINHQKKRKGLSKFCNFSFEPIGRSCDDQEEYHKISIGFLNSKNQPQSLHWIVISGTKSQFSPVTSEIQVRKTFLQDLSIFLSNSSYKRAKFLVNIPELIYTEEKLFGSLHKQYLVLEDISKTKKCNPSPPYFIQAGMDLTHLNLIISTLAQYHAVSLAWKQSMDEDSILEIYPQLSRPPCPNLSASKRSQLLHSFRLILQKIHNNCLPVKLELKLKYLQGISDSLC